MWRTRCPPAATSPSAVATATRRWRVPARYDSGVGSRELHGDHGTVGLGEVDADAPARRARQPTSGEVWLSGSRLAGLDDTGLSRGHQQRVALALALMTTLAVIFADEPTGNLDSASGEVILKMLRRASTSWGRRP